jgi:hypothetical protein
MPVSAEPAILPPPQVVPAPVMLAQSVPAGLQPIDTTPFQLPDRPSAFTTFQMARIHWLRKLPAKMFFNVNVENTLRLETNAFQTRNHQRADMVYRVLPDVNLGYAFTRKSRVSAEYFMYRDTYTEHPQTLDRTVQSVSLRGDHDFCLTPNTTLTTTLMGRELFISRAKDLSDILPMVSIVRRVGTYGAVYASVLGQIRWQEIVGGKFQEGDQFYSIGSIYRRPMWNLSADCTLIDNFGKGSRRGGSISNAGFTGLVPGPNSNHQIVLTLEAGRRLSQSIPLTAFVRAQPIFNIGQDKRQGFAGVNFRLFGGLRLEISKPAIFPVKLRQSESQTQTQS